MQVKWFYVLNKEKIGPIDQEAIISLLRSEEISLETYAWKKGLDNWTKVKDIPELSASVESEKEEQVTQVLEIKEEVQEDNKFKWTEVSNEDRVFYVKQSKGSTIFGPYSLEIVSELFKENRLSGKSLIFSPKMDNWPKLCNIPIYKDLFGEDPPQNCDEEVDDEKRPFLVKITNGHGDNFYEGVCRDISVGGVQVLSFKLPYKEGDEISMDIYEDSENHFQVEGRVVRVLEGEQGLFVRFKELDDQSRKTVSSYLANNPLD